MIIDAHTHISLYQKNAPDLESAFKLLLSEMKRNGIDYAIVIPDNIENDPHIADLDMARKLIRGHYNLFLLGSPQIIGGKNEDVEKYKNLLQEKVIKGIKLFPGHDPYYPDDERCLPYYQLCSELDVPVIFHTGMNTDHPETAKYNDPKLIADIARKFPKLKVVMTHYFWPRMEYCYEVTKDTPNIYFELAACVDPEVIDASGGMKKVKSIITRTISDRPDKVIFGTDWPMCRIQDHIKLVKSLNLGTDVENKIFYKNAGRVYKLPIGSDFPRKPIK